MKKKTHAEQIADLSMTFPRGGAGARDYDVLSPDQNVEVPFDRHRPYTEEEQGNIKIVTPLRTFNPESAAPQRFSKSKTVGPDANRFRKTDLGEYETANAASMLKPNEDFFPPQKRERTRAENISNLFASTLGGAGGGFLDVAALPRRLGDFAHIGMLQDLPSRADIGHLASGYERFLPLSPEALGAIREGPQVPGAEQMATLGSFAPYSALGKVSKYLPYVEKLSRRLMMGDTFLP